jgi:hypothetical protein
VDRIRVLVIMPPLQTDILRTAFASEPAIELVGQASADAAVDAVAATGAQVVVVGGEDVRGPTALNLLAAHPRLKVFGIAESGREAVLYEWRPVTTRLGELSPRLLIRAILHAAGRRRPEAAR